ncbi:F-box domain, Skp2-like domain protein [Rhodotorula toruloides]|uniref:F-box domain, Skp2-like domain protein n=1 Tax=Rhodotorula toruloides TaxID=5286 RepID=A0A511KPV4_RHOTO|nr:F-box domain, Skp2-like domain protein [Rhodotorula toruloides]
MGQHRPPIFTLPPEILVHALSLGDPKAAAAFSQTCQHAHALCESSTLWRSLHNSLFDSPAPTPHAEASSPSTAAYDFADATKKRTRAETLLDRLCEKGEPVPPAELATLLKTLVDAAHARPPVPAYLAVRAEKNDGDDVVSSQPSDSLNERWLQRVLSASGSWTAAGPGEPILAIHPSFSRDSSSARNLRSSSGSKEKTSVTLESLLISQLASHLHVLATPSPLAYASPSIRGSAKEIVYERVNYLRSSFFGPFTGDGSGRVDWRKVEAIAIVMGANLEDAQALGWGTDPFDGDDEEVESEDETVVPRGWRATRCLSAGSGQPNLCSTRKDSNAQVNGARRRSTSSRFGKPKPAADPRDWAGVTTHEFRGTYAFLHYPTYHRWNYHRSSFWPRSLTDEHEAVGDCMSLLFELLPVGEWPDEIDVADLSADAAADVMDDDADDEDWLGEGEGSTSGEDDDGTSEGSGNIYFTETGRASAESSQRRTPPTSPPEDEAEDNGGPTTPPLLSASQLSTLYSSPYPAYTDRALPPLPLSPLTRPTRLTNTFRPSTTAPSQPSSRPRLAFTGSSEPLAFHGTFTNAGHGPLSDRSVRGTVEWIEEDKCARWNMVIRYGGEDRWSMNGVQPGGPKSKMGILGIWSCADRSEEGPNGPFWYWPHVSPPEA